MSSISIQTVLSTYPNRGLLAQSFHSTILNPRGQYLSIRRTSRFKIFSTTSFAEPKLSELGATPIAKSNFASCSTALKYALDTSGPSSLRDAYRQHSKFSSYQRSSPSFHYHQQAHYAQCSYYPQPYGTLQQPVQKLGLPFSGGTQVHGFMLWGCQIS